MFKPTNAVAFTIFGKDIYWYGITMAVAIIVGVLVAMWQLKRKGYNMEVILDFAIIVIPCAVVGARLYYVIFAWDQFADNLLSILYIWQGGLAIYGGIIGGIIGGFILCKKRKYKFGTIADAVAPGLAIAQAIGRWGNYFNQEAFGYAVTDPRIINFPFACVQITKTHYVEVYDAARRTLCTAEFHLATFFYESVWNLIVFIILAIYLKRKRPRGNGFAWYMILYGIGRFIIEGLRVDSLWLIDGVIRISQAVSVVIMIMGIAYLVWNAKKGHLGMTEETEDIWFPKAGEPILNAKQIREKEQAAKTEDANLDSKQEEEDNSLSEQVDEEKTLSEQEEVSSSNITEDEKASESSQTSPEEDSNEKNI